MQNNGNGFPPGGYPGQFPQQPQYPAPMQGQGFPGSPQNQPAQYPQQPVQPRGYQPADPFATLGSTQASIRTPYFLVGQYEVQIESNDVVNGFDGSVYFGVNAKILRSSIPEHRPAGMVCRQSIKTTGNKAGMQNVKNYILGMMGIGPSHPQFQAACDAVNGPFLHGEVIGKQIFAGRVAILECTNIVTKESKKDFTVHNWQLKP